jgi:thiol-disulfide isomerase/thioredoxin
MPKTKTQSKKARTLKSKDTKSKSTKKTPKSKTSKAKKSLPVQEETVVLIYANWCPHCQSMKPEWNEMKNLLGPMVETIEIEDSDFDKDNKLRNIENLKLNGDKIDVNGYPTMFKIKNGRAEYYGGTRTATEMYNWVKGNTYGGYNKSKIRKTNKSIQSK